MGIHPLLLDLDPAHQIPLASLIKVKNLNVDCERIFPFKEKIFTENFAPYQVVIFDMGEMVKFNSSQISNVDIVALVTIPEIYSLVETYVLCKLISINSGHNHLALIANRIREKKTAQEGLEILFRVAEKFFPGKISLLGFVPELSSSTKNQPLVFYDKKDFSSAIDEITKNLLRFCSFSQENKTQEVKR